ncbi:orotidine-5'-phosphate decarboxylase [Stieleria varia]|uniref:Orotidine 5'-phosphate decarboxylase n=1 Tax=Stieleria varia TaxID=2528005 RepID=A0A5C6AT23_9BACT|nr:orotidine-5'-phosphate decarboxylase [Stieleria varia]TWU02226.1 Orotidine 5'-phosphate decarboxylase [Stieleria varia]
MSKSFATRMAEAVQKTKSVTCVGLDPRKAQLPAPIRDNVAADAPPDAWAAAYTQFCCEIVDVVRDLVPCVKPQAAFFEQLGPAGTVALGEVIRYASDAGLIVITDGKRNDIGSTATAYADAYLGTASPWGSDSLTVSPYLGEDSLEPFVEVCDQRDAGIFVLVKTSNPGGGLLQNRETDGQTVYARVAELVQHFNATRLDSFGYGPVGAVVGATYPEQLAEMRAAMPGSWILVPGFGAQGGGAADVMAGFDAKGLGAIVNNSRHIIFAHSRPEFADRLGDARWQDAVRAATVEMNEQLAVVKD